MALYYRQPKYFDKFKCIGGACSNTCCAGWDIVWLEKEVDKVKRAECSEKLNELVEKSFENNGNTTYSIILKENDECPFHNVDGLCAIQKELGEEYLSLTCSTYPRRAVAHGKYVTRCCSNSCPAVLDLLSEDNSALRMETRNVKSDFSIKENIAVDTQEKVKKMPVLFFRVAFSDFYNKIITDRKLSLETAVVLGALASKKFTEYSLDDKVTAIPKIIAEYENKLRDKATIRAIEEINPNPEIQFKLVNNLAITFFAERMPFDLSVLHDGEKLILENLEKGKALFNEAFKGREYFMKNLAANVLLDFYMPFFDTDYTIMENYIYFTLTVASFKVLGAAIALRGGNVEENFKYAVSVFSRTMFHSSGKVKNFMETMKKMGINSAAHAAFIIK